MRNLGQVRAKQRRIRAEVEPTGEAHVMERSHSTGGQDMLKSKERGRAIWKNRRRPRFAGEGSGYLELMGLSPG